MKSLNINANYVVPTSESGIFTFDTQAAVLLSFKYQALPSQASFQFAGSTTQGDGAQGTLPRVRLYTTADWALGRWNVGAANTYISRVADTGTGGLSYALSHATDPTVFAGRVAPYTSWDLRVTYHAFDADTANKGLTVTAGVNNLFDRLPPVSTNLDPASGASIAAWGQENRGDASTYGAIGRLIYISANYKF